MAFAANRGFEIARMRHTVNPSRSSWSCGRSRRTDGRKGEQCDNVSISVGSPRIKSRLLRPASAAARPWSAVLTQRAAGRAEVVANSLMCEKDQAAFRAKARPNLRAAHPKRIASFNAKAGMRRLIEEPGEVSCVFRLGGFRVPPHQPRGFSASDVNKA
jgi:hypothetical protein